MGFVIGIDYVSPRANSSSAAVKVTRGRANGELSASLSLLLAGPLPFLLRTEEYGDNGAYGGRKTQAPEEWGFGGQGHDVADAMTWLKEFAATHDD